MSPPTTSFICFFGVAAVTALPAVDRSDSEAGALFAALRDGTVSLDARYRYEFVDVDGVDKDAHASTVRVRLGYETATYRGFSGFLEFEGTRVVGNKLYNDPVDPMPRRPTVADPENAEFNRFWLRYAGVEDLAVTLGRQRIIHDGARFVGNVGWRQNEQTFDALEVAYAGIERLELSYDFVWNVQRIFGEGASDASTGLPTTGEDAMASHFLRGAYEFEDIGTLSAFGYSLDYSAKDALDSHTAGARFAGSWSIDDDWSVVYAASVASQTDAYDNDADLSEIYYLVEAGARWKTLDFKLGYEVLTGDGSVAFQTPLATGHKYHGWADRFLATPATGLEDLYLVLGGGIPTVEGLDARIAWHRFESTEDDIAYGSEFDVVASYRLDRIDEKLTVGAKAAVYSAEDVGEDVTKVWLWTQWSY